MSLSFDLHNELKERISVPEILGGAAFVPGSGRVYRLFGSEEEPFSVPEIPALPPICAALKKTAVSLEEALQQIDSFFSPAEPKVEREEPVTELPTLQLFPALGESAPPRLIKKAASSSSGTLPAAALINEVLQTSPTPKKERRKTLRVVREHVAEPFIVPFAKPEVKPKSPPEETDTKSPALKIVTEVTRFVLPALFSKTFRKCWLRRRKENGFYRKPYFPFPVRAPLVEETAKVSVPKSGIDTSTFRWAQPLESLIRTADNQIRMLTDHLIVQSNQGVKAICFKGVFPGDGCSTILLCAAWALMERGYHVLLVDAHHRHIDLPKQLNLVGNLDSENEVIAIDEHLGLWVWQESRAEEENRDILAEVVTAYREKYDLILLDDGSVTERPLAEFVELWDSVELDGVLLVSNTKRPTEMPVSHIAGRFRQHHIHLIGIAENYV